MTRTLLPALAAAATLAVLAAAPADAQQLRHAVGAPPPQPSGFAAQIGPGPGPGLPGGPQLLQPGATQLPSPATWGAAYALRLYVQKCLDNMLPECP